MFINTFLFSLSALVKSKHFSEGYENFKVLHESGGGLSNGITLTKGPD